MTSKVIIGIDPGLKNTGWGVVEVSGSTRRCLAYGCIATRSDHTLPSRLGDIHRGLLEVIDRYSPTESAVENVFFGMNPKSALATGQARGVCILALADAGVAFSEYAPTQVKSAVVGQGRAEKHQIAFMVRAMLDLPAVPTPEHAADALALALCHANLAPACGFRRVVL